MLVPRDLPDGTSARDEDARKAFSSATERGSNSAHRSRSKRAREGPYERLMELEGAVEEARNLRHLLDVANERNINLMKSNQELSNKLGESAVTISKANDDVRILQSHIQQQAHLIEDLTMNRNQLVEKTRELDACRQQKQDIEALLRVRTAELRDAKQYLAKADTISYADVRRMVETLNSQIFQLAAQIVDKCSFEETRPHQMPEAVQACCDSVGKFLGSELTHVVSTSVHADDPMLVQVVVQAYLAQRVSHIIRAWAAADMSPSQDSLLSKIHDNISESESQAVSARWRTLTRRYVDPGKKRYEEYSLNTRGSITRGLSRILALSGVSASGTVKDLENGIDDIFGEKVAGIVGGALGLLKIVGEEISTTEFEVLCPRYGQRFVASMMENVDDTRENGHVTVPEEKASIICTTELGLRRYGKKATVGDGEEKREESVLLKAKVALPTLMEDFISQLDVEDVEVPDVRHHDA